METIPIGSQNWKIAMQFAAIGRTDPAIFVPSWNVNVMIFIPSATVASMFYCYLLNMQF